MNGWPIDKHIPIVSIVTILLQTFAVVWFIAGLSFRLAAVEAMISNHALQLTEIRRVQEMRSERIIRLEEQLSSAQQVLQRIETKLDALGK